MTKARQLALRGRSEVRGRPMALNAHSYLLCFSASDLTPLNTAD